MRIFRDANENESVKHLYFYFSPHHGLSLSPPLVLTSSHVPPWHADIVISVIIYLLMQTWPCPRYAVRQKYSYCSHCETNKEWDRKDINYSAAATIFHISQSSLYTHTHTHTMHACLMCFQWRLYIWKRNIISQGLTYLFEMNRWARTSRDRKKRTMLCLNNSHSGETGRVRSSDEGTSCQSGDGLKCGPVRVLPPR